MNRNDGAVGDARKRQAERDEFDVPERLAYLIAQAWDEGYDACHEHVRDGLWGKLRPIPDNPYHDEASR